MSMYRHIYSTIQPLSHTFRPALIHLTYVSAPITAVVANLATFATALSSSLAIANYMIYRHAWPDSPAPNVGQSVSLFLASSDKWPDNYSRTILGVNIHSHTYTYATYSYDLVEPYRFIQSYINPLSIDNEGASRDVIRPCV
jgi:hypothetical protein